MSETGLTDSDFTEATEPYRLFADWLKDAEETPGSWWPHWQAWIEDKDNARVDAKKRKPGGGKLKPIEDAPGSFVRAKA